MSFANDEDYQKYLRLFHWRESQDEIVNARYIFVHSNEECCSSLINGQVYVENIPIRLVNIEDIPYPENLYVLQSSLDGFKKLREWAGFFKVVEDMVCIDRNGKVKTWVNTDLSLIQVPRDKEWEAGLVDEMHL